MDSSILKKSGKYLKEQNKRKRWGTIAAAAAVITAIAVTCTQAATATAVETVYCGFEEEHVHTEACYERVLVCGYDAEMSSDEEPTETAATETTASETETEETTPGQTEEDPEEGSTQPSGENPDKGTAQPSEENPDEGPTQPSGENPDEGPTQPSGENPDEELKQPSEPDASEQAKDASKDAAEESGAEAKEDNPEPSGEADAKRLTKTENDSSMVKSGNPVKDEPAADSGNAAEKDPEKETGKTEGTNGTDDPDGKESRPAQGEKKEEDAPEDGSHVHTEECYELRLICGKEEHTHTEYCYIGPEISKEEAEKIVALNKLIEELPGYEEFLERLAQFGEAGDDDGYGIYYIDTYRKTEEGVKLYGELSAEAQEYVRDIDKFSEMVLIWGDYLLEDTAATLAMDSQVSGGTYQYTANVRSVNNLNYNDWSWNCGLIFLLHSNKQTDLTIQYIAQTRLGLGVDRGSLDGEVRYAPPSKAYRNCLKNYVGVIYKIADEGDPGAYQIVDIIGAEKGGKEWETNERVLKTDEFAVLYYNFIPPVEVGDYADTNISPWDTDFTGENGSSPANGKYSYSQQGWFIVVNKNNTNPAPDPGYGLEKIPTADTSGLIKINLYDYDSSINSGNTFFPFFPQPGGTTGINTVRRIQSGTASFGDNIVKDRDESQTQKNYWTGINNAIKNGQKNINQTYTQGGGTWPLNRWMNQGHNTVYQKLVNGYPALNQDQNISLGYLFGADSSRKINTGNITGLFQYDESTGYYSYDSLKHHAQYNSGTGEFEVYDGTITPNYAMYPFGNFLPFNDINQETTLVSDGNFGRDDFVRMAANARQKALKEPGKQNAEYSYGVLADEMAKFIALMDEKYGDDWKGYQAANAYFKAYKGTEPFESNNDGQLQNLYNIDYDKAKNFQFGMDMELKFMQPKGGVTSAGGDMVYRFTGDDDVWIYIDDQLTLDLSGRHRQVGGEIDFKHGVVRYYPLTDVIKGTVDFAYANPVTVPFSQIFDANSLNAAGTFKDYTTHTFKFYYMERGSGSGVCSMEFNLPVIPDNAFSVTKEVSVEGDPTNMELLGNPDFYFQVLRTNGTVLSNQKFELWESWKKIGDRSTDEKGIFTIKEGQTAIFTDKGMFETDSSYEGTYFIRELVENTVYSQYGEIIVNGNTTTKQETGETTVDGFTGADSMIEKGYGEASSIVFSFDNRVMLDKVGRLAIQKIVVSDEESGLDPEKAYEMTVILNPGEAGYEKLLPAGSRYTVYEKEGDGWKTAGTEKTVEKEGVITIKADEKAVIANVLAGTKYKVQEASESAKGFTVTYSNAEGTVAVADEGKPETMVTVTNTNGDARSAVITIPFRKLLERNYDDGREHTYHFEIQEVTDQSGTASVDGGYKETVSVTVPKGANEGNGSFGAAGTEIRYWGRRLENGENKRYYLIRELAREQNDGTVYDASEYVAEVTIQVDKEDLNKAISAAITNIYQDGAAVSVPDGFTAGPIFKNQLASPQWKIVKQNANSTETKRFFVKDAQFTLTNTDASVTEHKVYYGKSGEDGVLVWYTEPADQDGNYDESKKASALAAGTYTLAETQAPAGYMQSMEQWTLVIREQGLWSVTSGSGEAASPVPGAADDGVITFYFNNEIIYELPGTGGAGMYRYMIGGMLLMAAGALVLYKNKKELKSNG